MILSDILRKLKEAKEILIMTTKPALFQLLLTLPIFFLLFAPQKAAHPQVAQNKNLVAVKHFSDKSYLEVIWSDTGDYLLIENQAEPSKSEDMITATLVSTKTKKERRLKRLEETLRRLYGDFRSCESIA